MLPSTTESVRPSSFRAWVVAARPRSLWVALSPVLVGATLALERVGTVALAPSLLVLACALLVQVITNLQNDVGYTVRGGERRGDRRGLPRATANGWLDISTVRIAIVMLCAIATGLGIGLVAFRGWPVLAVGAASLAAALAYMAGPRPIAYTPFGEATVFVFFGLVAVTGTDWVLTGEVGPASVLAAIAIGCLAAAALAVNNHRDIDHDRSAGRRTFAVLAGAARSLRLYAILMFTPFLLLPFIAVVARDPWLLLPAVLFPATVRLRRDFATCVPGLAFNGILFRTFEMELRFAAAMALGASIGWLLR